MYMEGASTMTNFDFLKDDPQFSGFADAAIAAERILPIDAATAVLDCRRAMEFAVKWTAPSSSRGMISSSA